MLMARLLLYLIFKFTIVCSDNVNRYAERIEACQNLNCDTSSNISVCGIRKEMTTVRFKLFPNECALLKYGCSVEDKDAYGLVNMKHCKSSTKTNADTLRDVIVMNTSSITENLEKNNSTECELDCNYSNELVCGIRQDGEGYRVKIFNNTCELSKYNCNTTLPFTQTDKFICEGSLNTSNNSIYNNNIDPNSEDDRSVEHSKSIIVIDGSLLGPTTDANETIENFFAATHVLDLPIKEIDDEFKTRRMLLKNVGPVKVFKPWITIPKIIKTDHLHMPTLSTCYHKCPTQCPDTYSPVCGVPGILAREPSIMFQNHCYMDVAQCKMYWENKSSTAISSSYIESSFLFCLGDQLNGMYRFLPLIKTLQHMGRLKKKAKYHYRLKNMRFFNNHAYKEPKLMG